MKDKILEWASERGLTSTENPESQFLKLAEEVGELADCISRDDKPGQIDAIGDIQVVLIILAKKLGFDIDECLEYAYDEIKNRTGKTINGVFLKDGEKRT